MIVDLIINAIITFIPVLIVIAFTILFERKLLGAIQRREGPNNVGLFGLLQSFVDGFKLIFKENILPYKSNKILFFLCSLLIFVMSLSSWSLIPISEDSTNVDSDYTIFIIFAFSIINVYFIILAG